MAESSKRTVRAEKRRKKIFASNFVLVVAATVVCLLLGAYLGIGKLMESETFPETTVVDGIDVSGMTYQTGSGAVLEQQRAQLESIRIPLTYNGNEAVFGAEELGVSGNAETILPQAYGANKKTENSLLENYDLTVALRKQPQEFRSSITVDQDVLARTIAEYLEQHDRQPVDARASFDKETQTFSYTKSENGTKADADKVCASITEQIEAGDNSTIQVIGEVVPPEVTTEKLKENTVLIGHCETTATNNENRNTNIRLMCEAVNGLAIEPGQTLSINELVGQRTKEKGFQEAPAIMDGKRLENDVGGGICQLSGTLYNAALEANMEIVERVRHSFPSAYLPIGLDATLNWDDKDLKIRNTSESPIYIGATFEDQVVSVNLYGQPLPEGMEVEIVTEMIAERDPGNPEIISTDTLPAGIRQTKTAARKGYDVDVYREYYQDGVLVRRELISQDRFPAIKAVILEGTASEQK